MTFFDRAAWGAKSPRCAVSTIDITKRTEFIVHYSTGQELGREDCAQWVREIQAFHQNTRGWCDIGYNFLVCKHGDIFEGRGWNKVGAHAPNHNAAAIGVCFLGNDDPDLDDTTPQARAAVKSLLRDLITKAGHSIQVLGHRDVKATSCPGNELYDWIGAGMPVDQPQSKPAPVPIKLQGGKMRIPFPDVKLDGNGNGWFRLGAGLDSDLVSDVTFQNPDHLYSHYPPRWSRGNNAKDGATITLHGGVPHGTYNIYVFVEEPA